MRSPGAWLNVLVVDDSAVMRQMMGALLSSQPGIRVSVAHDPFIAMSKMALERPDVILLDLSMPRMDGLTFLRHIMPTDPIPVVVCSGLVGPGTEAALSALLEGAVEIVAKPTVGLAGFLNESSERLVEVVRCAARARVRPRQRASHPRAASGTYAVVAAPSPAPRRIPVDRVIAIGASTGGPEALRLLLEPMPPDAPAMVIVQHMPEPFTAAFARQLDQNCRIEVREARPGDRVIPGRALIAPGNRHLVISQDRQGYVVEFALGPPDVRHRPSVDVLFRSVAGVVGQSAVGVLLTGMGDDGSAGLLEMKRAGAWTIAQDEATSVVFGMPKEAIRLGAADEVLPLPRIARALLTHRASNSSSQEG